MKRTPILAALLAALCSCQAKAQEPKQPKQVQITTEERGQNAGYITAPDSTRLLFTPGPGVFVWGTEAIPSEHNILAFVPKHCMKDFETLKACVEKARRGAKK